MSKKLQNILEVYAPVPGDEKRFVKKHVVVKTQDANGNKDDVFQATNVKKYKRSLEHGYDTGDDEKVYESVLDEAKFGPEKFINVASSKKSIADAEKALADNPNMFHGAKAGFKKQITIHKKHLEKYNTQKESLDDYSIEEIEEFMMSEEFEQLDELSKRVLGDYVDGAKANLDTEKEVDKQYPDTKKFGKTKQRMKGIARATRKMSESADLGSKDKPSSAAYAIAMNMIKKQTGDSPPMSKKNIKRAHARAKDIATNPDAG